MAMINVQQSFNLEFPSENDKYYIFYNFIDFSFSMQGSFDGNSLKVAELLFKNGFKGAYAIKGGVRGKKGWIVCFLLLLYYCFASRALFP